MNLITSLTSKNYYYGTRYNLMPTSKQLAVIETDDKYYEEVFSRQEGASTACVIKAIENAINNPGCIVRVFNHVSSIALCNYNLACSFLTGNALRNELYKIAKVRRTIELANGSIISFHYNNVSARGLAADCVIIDNGKNMSDYDLDVIKAMTYGSNGQVISLR